MRKKILSLIALTIFPTILLAQINEPEFIGDVVYLKDSTNIVLGQEIGNFTSGLSWSANSLNALSLEVSGKKSNTRLPSSDKTEIIVRCNDNMSNPMSIIRIIKLKTKRNKRVVVLSEDNSGTLMKSRTNSKSDIIFRGKKYGNSSYLLQISHLGSGEYCIMVSNPNNIDEKRTTVSTFGID